MYIVYIMLRDGMFVCSLIVSKLNKLKEFQATHQMNFMRNYFSHIIYSGAVDGKTGKTKFLPRFSIIEGGGGSGIMPQWWSYLTWCGAKGQIISKWFLVSSISSKKRTKEFDFTSMIPPVDLFSFFFGGNRRHQKAISKLSDL